MCLEIFFFKNEDKSIRREKESKMSIDKMKQFFTSFILKKKIYLANLYYCRTRFLKSYINTKNKKST